MSERSSKSLTADEMIAALDAFEAEDGCDANQFRLYPIVEGFKDLLDRHRVVPAMFALMERFPDADLGTPGPLVHSIESLGAGAYETLLVESVRRQPVDLNVWMVNRILNVRRSPEFRRELLDLMRLASEHPRVTPRVAESARRFLQRQATRDAH